MNLALFVISLINLSTCCIVTTSIAFKIVYHAIVAESYREEELERHVKTIGIFALTELITSVVMVMMNANAWIPLILLFLALIITGIAIYYNFKLFEMNTMDNEDMVRRINIVRLLLWLARYVCVFGFIISLV